MPDQLPSANFVLHHEKPLTRDLARSLLQAFRPDVHQVTRAPFTEEDTERVLTALEKDGFQGGPTYRFADAPPTNPSAAFGGGELSLWMAPPVKTMLPWKGTRDAEVFEVEPERWVMVHANQDFVRVRDQESVQWFLKRMRALLPVLEPDFGFVDTDVNVTLHAGRSPWDFVWPAMLYGPARVASLGLDRLLASPAWRVERLPYGGVWVQAAENPIPVGRAELKRLAAHLNLKVPAREL